MPAHDPPGHLGLGFISSGSQPHRLKLELSGVVPAFLAFRDVALLRLLCRMELIVSTLHARA
jgi:hypothetical protein